MMLSTIGKFLEAMLKAEFLTPFGWLNALGVVLIFALARIKMKQAREQVGQRKRKGAVTEMQVFVCFMVCFVGCAAVLAVLECVKGRPQPPVESRLGPHK